MAVFPELWSEVWSFSVARGADCCSEEERILSWKEKRSFPCTLSIIMGETSIGVSISLVYERKVSGLISSFLPCLPGGCPVWVGEFSPGGGTPGGKPAFCLVLHLSASRGERGIRPGWPPVDNERPELSPFPGFHEQQHGPVPESQVVWVLLTHPPPPAPTCPFLPFACQVPEETHDKALANSVKLDQNAVGPFPVAAKSG